MGAKLEAILNATFMINLKNPTRNYKPKKNLLKKLKMIYLVINYSMKDGKTTLNLDKFALLIKIN